MTHTNFNYLAVEIGEIEKINSKKSGPKNHRWKRQITKSTMSSIKVAMALRLLIKVTIIILAVV